MALAMREVPRLDDDEAIAALSRSAPGWRFEFDADGTMHVSPTYGDGGPRDVEATVQLRRYADVAGGKVFGSSAGFRLPDESLRSPDASWISQARIDALAPKDRTKFWRVCPEVVVEILSATDAWPDLLAKLDAYERNGAVYVVAIDPFDRREASRGTPPAGLVLDTAAIMRA